MQLFSERGYYPVKTIYRSQSADVFLCRKMGEGGIYTVNCVKMKEIISFCLTEGSLPYEDIVETFLWEQNYFLVYRWHEGNTISQAIASEPEKAMDFMMLLCKKILLCSLPPALLYQALEEDCVCVQDGKIFLNCFFRFPLCWEDKTEANLPERARELLEICIETSVKKEKAYLLLFKEFRKDMKKQFESGAFPQMLSLYLYVKSVNDGFTYKSIPMLIEDYREKLKAVAARAMPYLAAAAALAAVAAVYFNWVMSLRESLP